jgi:hypothetical protein
MRSSFTFISLVIFLAIPITTTDAVGQETGTRNRRSAASASGAEATITVNEQFLNSFLTAVFDNLNEPSMPLTIGGAKSTAECPSDIRLKREVSGVRTAVRFQGGKIVGPLAFAGAYNASLMGCIQFSGWADAEVDLSYDGARRALVAWFRIREIHLNNTPAALSGPLLTMVQGTIDRRYNPVELVTLEKVSTRVDVAPAGGALQMRATAIRPEITSSSLTLHITYEFGRG